MAMTDEGFRHIPFGRGVEEGQFFAGFEITRCGHQHPTHIEQHGGCARVVATRPNFADIDVLIRTRLHGVAGGIVLLGQTGQHVDDLASFEGAVGEQALVSVGGDEGDHVRALMQRCHRDGKRIQRRRSVRVSAHFRGGPFAQKQKIQSTNDPAVLRTDSITESASLDPRRFFSLCPRQSAWIIAENTAKICMSTKNFYMLEKHCFLNKFIRSLSRSRNRRSFGGFRSLPFL